MAELEAELILPPLPRSALHLWSIYWRLRRRKAGSGFGVAPLEWPDFDAFCRVTGTRLRSWEIDVLERTDDAFITEEARAAKERAGKEEAVKA